MSSHQLKICHAMLEHFNVYRNTESSEKSHLKKLEIMIINKLENLSMSDLIAILIFLCCIIKLVTGIADINIGQAGIFVKVIERAFIKLGSSHILAPEVVINVKTMLTSCYQGDKEEMKESFWKALKSLYKSVSTSAIYAVIFGKNGLTSTLTTFDPSGHALLSLVHANNVTEYTSGNYDFQKIYHIAWSLGIAVVNIFTTFNFHTEGEMLTGMGLVPIVLFVLSNTVPKVTTKVLEETREYLKYFYNIQGIDEKTFVEMFEKFEQADFTVSAESHCIDYKNDNLLESGAPIDKMLAQLDTVCDKKYFPTRYSKVERLFGKGELKGYGVAYVNKSKNDKGKLCCKLRPTKETEEQRKERKNRFMSS